MTLADGYVLIGILVLVAGTWACPRHLRPGFWLLAAAALLLHYSPLSLILLVVNTALVYGLLQLRPAKPLLLAVIAAVAGELIVYRALHVTVELPVILGFAYYTLRLIHVLVEAYKSQLPKLSVGEFTAYMFFPPILAAGPIARVEDVQRQMRRQRWDAVAFSASVQRVLVGYTKIIFFGNTLMTGGWAGLLKTLPPLDPWQFQLLDSVRYGLNLYFQFAGYSDVAIGVAGLLGIKIAENFKNPFFKSSIGDFWNAWHITLSHWCRDYIYYPMVALTRVRAVGIVASMLTLALWHEFSLRYLFWGLHHGFGIVLWRLWQQVRPTALVDGPAWIRRPWRVVATMITFSFVMLGFVWTKEADWRMAVQAYLKIVGVEI